MKDLIKRSDVIEALRECRGLSFFDKSMAISVVRIVPSADKPQGEWIVDEKGKRRCSVCGVREEQFVYGLGEYWYGRGESKFCPNCGSDMRKGSKENPLAGIEPKPIPTKKHTFVYRKGADDE